MSSAFKKNEKKDYWVIDDKVIKRLRIKEREKKEKKKKKRINQLKIC